MTNTTGNPVLPSGWAAYTGTAWPSTITDMLPVTSPVESVLMTFCAATGSTATAKPAPSATFRKPRRPSGPDRLLWPSKLSQSVIMSLMRFS